jgi:hypothetical protein
MTAFIEHSGFSEIGLNQNTNTFQSPETLSYSATMLARLEAPVSPSKATPVGAGADQFEQQSELSSTFPR